MESIPNKLKRERLTFINDCLKMATPVLLSNPGQFATQLQGRLLSLSPDLSNQIVAINNLKKPSWLKLLFPSLGQPGGALKLTLQNEEEIMAVRISEDGSRVACLFSNYIVRVWDLQKKSIIFEYPAEMGMSALGFSPDGKMIAFTDENCEETLVMDVDQSTKLMRLQGEANQIYFTNNGKFILWSNEKGLFICQTGSRNQQCLVNLTEINRFCTDKKTNIVVISKSARSFGDTFEESVGRFTNKNLVVVFHREEGTNNVIAQDLSVSCLSVNDDGSAIVVGNEDGTIHVFSGISNRRKFVLKGHSDEVYSVAVSADGTRAASGASDNTLRLWDLHLGKEITVLPTSSTLQSLDMTADGKTIVSGCRDGTLQIWDVDNAIKNVDSEFHHDPDQINNVCFAHFGNLAAVENRSDKVGLLNLETENITIVPNIFNGKLRDYDGKYILISNQKELVLMNTEKDHQVIWKIREPHHVSDAVIVSPTCVAAVNGDPAIHIWKSNDSYQKILIVSKEKQAEFQRDALTTRLPVNIATGPIKISADGKYAITNMALNPPELWDLVSEKKLKTFNLADTDGIIFAWDVDQKFSLIVLAVKLHQFEHGLLIAVDVNTGKEIIKIPVPDIPNQVSISNDGLRAVVGFSNGSMKAFQLDTGEELGAFTGDTPLEKFRINHDGSFIAAIEGSGSIHRLMLAGYQHTSNSSG